MTHRTAFSLLIAAMLIVTSCAEESETYPQAAETVGLDLSDDVSWTERYRPQFHYTPPTNWMNDPNGLVYYDGQYHLFYQYNPFGDTWGHMSWYHAVSEDLVHWDHRGVKIPEEGNEMIFSGSAVVDHHNTTGFQDGEHPPMVAVYSSHYTLEDGTEQAQSLAYSTDGGETFTKYEGNPVIEHEDPDFRDPNVIWQEDEERWLMVVALPQQRKVQFYESENLTDWDHLSDFGPAGSVEGIWECPDFFELPVDGDPDNTRWVLHVDVNPGAIAGGSGSQYFIGDFDGTAFTPDESTGEDDVLWTDFGTDFYAAITWNDIPEDDGRRMWVGWMSNWEYAGDKPTNPWRGAQSVPRSIHLRTVGDQIRMVQEPVEELQQLRQNHTQLGGMAIEDGDTMLEEEGIAGKALELIAEIDPGDADVVGLKVRRGDDEETVIGYDVASSSVFVDRTNSGETDFHEAFATRSDAPVTLENGRIRLHVLVDWSSVEVFANDGAAVLTSRIFPNPESEGVSLFSEGGTANLERLDAWTLRSVWR